METYIPVGCWSGGGSLRQPLLLRACWSNVCSESCLRCWTSGCPPTPAPKKREKNMIVTYQISFHLPLSASNLKWYYGNFPNASYYIALFINFNLWNNLLECGRSGSGGPWPRPRWAGATPERADDSPRESPLDFHWESWVPSPSWTESWWVL